MCCHTCWPCMESDFLVWYKRLSAWRSRIQKSWWPALSNSFHFFWKIMLFFFTFIFWIQIWVSIYFFFYSHLFLIIGEFLPLIILLAFLSLIIIFIPVLLWEKMTRYVTAAITANHQTSKHRKGVILLTSESFSTAISSSEPSSDDSASREHNWFILHRSYSNGVNSMCY